MKMAQGRSVSIVPLLCRKNNFNIGADAVSFLQPLTLAFPKHHETVVYAFVCCFVFSGLCFFILTDPNNTSDTSAKPPKQITTDVVHSVMESQLWDELP